MGKSHVAFSLLVTVAAAAFVIAFSAYAQSEIEKFYPVQLDPFTGNWEGRWSGEEDVDPDISAQVIPQGRDKYLIKLASKIFMRSPVLAEIEVKAENGVLSFDQDDFKGEIRDGKFTGGRRSGRKTFEMKRTTMHPTLGARRGQCQVLDGTGFDAWQDAKG